MVLGRIFEDMKRWRVGRSRLELIAECEGVGEVDMRHDGHESPRMAALNAYQPS